MDENKKAKDYLWIINDLSKYILALSLATYLSGFIITNIYLGTLGVNQLNLFRARYIIVGVMFILFCASVFYLCYGLNKILNRVDETNSKERTFLVIKFSLENLGAIFFTSYVFSYLERSMGNPRRFFSSSGDFSLHNSIIKSGKFYLRIIFIILILIFIIFLISMIVVIVQSIIKKRKIHEFREVILNSVKELFLENTEFKKFLPKLVINLAIAFLTGGIIYNVLLGQSNAIEIEIDNKDVGFLYYFLGIIYIYLFYLSLVILYRKEDKPNNSNDKKKEEIKNPLRSYISKIYLVGFLIALFIPIYTFGIYSRIPQQLGGGRAISVDIVFSSETLEEKMLCDDYETYLIDRSSDYTVVVIECSNNDDIKVVELTNTVIDSIVY